MRIHSFVVSVCLFASLTACSNDDADTSIPVDPGFVVSAAIFAPGSDISSYVGVVPNLGADATLDPAGAIEVAGLSLLYVKEGSGEFFVDSVANLTLTKYAIADGQPEARGQLSFSGLGFATTQRTSANVFASDTRAYLIDSGTLQMVVWNPATMEIDETVALDGLARDGFFPFVYVPVVRGRTAFFPFAYSDPVGDTTRPESVVLALDLDTGTRTVLTDDSCGDAVYAMLAENGDIYLASGTANAATEYLGRTGIGESCLRRIPAGSMAFDEDYHPAIASFVDGDIAGGLIAGPDGSVYVRVLEDGALPPDLALSAQILAAPAWSWWRLDLESGSAALASIAPSAGRFTTFEVSGKTYATQSTANFSSTILIETTMDPPISGLEILGIASGLGRL